MPIVDTHCHYNMEPLYSGQEFIFNFKKNDPLLKMSWQDHWQHAQKKGVIGSVVIGTMIETSNLALEIAATDEKLLATVGVHPNHAHETTIEELDQVVGGWLDRGFAAVGETGLDFYRLDRSASDFKEQTNQQQAIFIWHLKLAEKADVPVILHVRVRTDQAYWQTLEVFEKEYQGNQPFVLHCASGPKEYIKKAMAMGGFVGFDGNITYPNAQEIRDLIASVPTKRLLIETDAPFLAPQNQRGKVCEPWMIAKIAEYVTQELQIDLNQLLDNTQRFFDHQFVK
jgi:TatD DNase family protein